MTNPKPAEMTALLDRLLDRASKCEGCFREAEAYKAARRLTPAPGPSTLRASAWVSVEERLPEKQQPVLFVAGPKSHHYAGQVFGGKYVDGLQGFTTPEMGFDASYWQPSPAAPPLAEPQEAHTAAQCTTVNCREHNNLLRGEKETRE